MSDKETVQQISGFGLPFTGDGIAPIQEPEFGISAEYIDSGGGYKYFSAMKLAKPIYINGYSVLDLFKFLTEALCRRFHPDGSEEILDPMRGVWDKR